MALHPRMSLIAVWLLCGWCSYEHVRADGTSVESIRPVAGTQGTVFTVTAIGSGLEHASEVLFYQPGVRCRSLKVLNDEELILELEATADCMRGLHPFRVRSPKGLSELRTLCVTGSPVVLESEESPGSEIQLLEGNTSLAGTLSGDTVDRFRVRLNKGARFAAEIEAVRLGISLLDTSLTVRDPAGKIVASVDDTFLYRQDPALSLVAEQQGEYTIEVREAGSGQADGAPYLLHVGDFPRPMSVFPLGGQVNTALQVDFAGDCQGPFQDRIKLPAEISDRYALLPSRHGNSTPTAIPFRVSRFPNAIESEPNDSWDQTRDNAEPLDLPVAWNGVLEKPGDRDCCWVRVRRGERLDFEVHACRLGSPVDTLLTVVDESSQEIGRSDDLETHDSHVTIDVDQDGLLGLMVEDKRGEGGAAFFYRLEVTQKSPEVAVFLARRDRLSQNRQTIDVPAGNRVLAFFGTRQNVAESEGVAIRFPSLPAGVQPLMALPTRNEFVIPVVFEASLNAVRSGALVPVEATARFPQGDITGQFHQVVDLIGGPADTIYQELVTHRLAVSVIDPLPFTLEVTQPKATLVRDGTLNIDVKLIRQPGFDAPVEVSVPWLPPWVDAEPKFTIPRGESQATIQVRAWKQATIGTWPLVLEATSRSGGASSAAGAGVGASSTESAAAVPSSVAVASTPVVLEVGSPLVVGSVQTVAGEQGQAIPLACSLTAATPLLGEWTATLEGLPNRVHSDPVRVLPSDRSIQFQISLEPTAPIGTFAGLACRLSGKVQGQSVSYVIARDGKLTVATPGSVVRDAQGRPLSRLEILRSKLGEMP